MNPQWNTPPDGDFARYVEQLSARSAVARRASEAGGDYALDAGMTPTDEPHERPAAGRGVAQQAAATRPLPVAHSPGSSQRPASVDLLRGALLVWAGVLVAMVIANLPLALVLLVFGGGLWLAHRFRRRLLPPGIASWRAWLEDMARQTAAKQQRQQGK